MVLNLVRAKLKSRKKRKDGEFDWTSLDIFNFDSKFGYFLTLLYRLIRCNPNSELSFTRSGAIVGHMMMMD